GRKINDDMGKYVAENTVKNMIKANKQINGSDVAIFGITFKENCPDVRNTKVVDVIEELKDYGVNVLRVDPVADKEDLWREYGIELCNIEEVKDMDGIIFAVPHNEFKSMTLEDVKKFYASKDNEKDGYVLVDVKGMFN